MHTVTTAPEFAALTDDDIEQALNELDGMDEDAIASQTSPVLRELERLIGAYSDRFEALCSEDGEVPEGILDFEADSPIQQAAYEIFMDALHDSMQEEDDD